MNIDSIFPHIQKNQLEAIPIIQADEQSKRQIVTFVDKILSAKHKNAQTDIKDLECEIDKIVYRLYDLTSEEIDIIQGTH